MKKFSITCHEEREAFFTIEANDVEEAKQLVVDKIRNDDYFCDEIAEMYEMNVLNEEIKAYEADPDDTVDYDYAEMTKEEK